jgi:cobalt-zinc-cadmium efflux system protein
MNVPHAAMPDRPEDGGSSHSSHAHRINESSDRRLLGIGLFLIVGFMIVEIAVGLATHSLTLLADAGHMLTDAGALALSIWAIGLALRPTLLVISIVIAAEAVNRLLHPQPVIGTAMIVVAAVGVIVNIAATFAVSRANQASLNITGALGHLLTDLWAFAGTLVAGVLIVTTGFRRADPIASLLVVALMLRTSWRLLKDSGRILLEAAPAGIDLEEVREHFMSVEHVRDIHDLHAWVVTSDLPALSAHVVIDDSCFTDGHAPQILDQLQRCLTGHFDLDHSTFQLEPEEHGGHEGSTH